MKIFDCTTYYSEDLILDLRFNTLDKFVDYFIVCEAKFTHSGNEKQLNFNIKNFEKFKNEQILIGVLNPYSNKEKIKKLLEKKINCFSLELLPRITRAQSMDILSSQANLAGYKAVVDSFSNFEKAFSSFIPRPFTLHPDPKYPVSYRLLI